MYWSRRAEVTIREEQVYRWVPAEGCGNRVKKRLGLSALDFVILENTTLPPKVEIINIRNPIARQHNVLRGCFLLFPLPSGEVEINIANFMNIFMDIQFYLD